MFCSMCGTEVSRSAVYCHSCGYQLTLRHRTQPNVKRAEPAIEVVELINSAPTAGIEEGEKSLSGVRGWLLFLCICLTGIGPIYTIWTLEQTYYVVLPYMGTHPHLQAAFHIELVVSLILVLFGFLAGMALWCRWPAAVLMAKAFFACLGAYLLLRPFIISSFTGMRLDIKAPELLRGFLSSMAWIAYLTWSKRVKETYRVNVQRPKPNGISQGTGNQHPLNLHWVRSLTAQIAIPGPYVCALAVACLMIGIFFWPTLYRYDQLTSGTKTVPVRINRVTGNAQFLTIYGWRHVGSQLEPAEKVKW